MEAPHAADALADLASDLCERAVATGASDAEVYARQGLLTRVTAQRGVVSEAAGWVADLALRAWSHGRMALGTTNDLSSAGVAELARRVAEEAPRGSAAVPALLAGTGSGQTGAGADDDPGGGDNVPEAIEGLMGELEARVPPGGIVNVTYSGGSRRIALVTSRGFRGAHRASRHVLWAWLEIGGAHAVVGASARRFAGLDLGAVADELARRSGLLAGAGVGLSSRSCPVLLPPDAASDIARSLGTVLTGEHGLGNEALRRRLGSPIASPALTVVDDATMDGGLLTRPFDDEGSPSARTVLVQEGVLHELLHTRATAARLGMAPNGKAVRPELWDQPRSGPSNLCIAAGAADAGELRAELAPGLMVTATQRPATLRSGRLTMVVEGWWVEQGEPVQAVSGVRLSAKLFDLLGAIRACGRDLRFSPLAHGAGAPSLLVDRMAVG